MNCASAHMCDILYSFTKWTKKNDANTFGDDVTRNVVVKAGSKIRWNQLNIEDASIIMGIAITSFLKGHFKHCCCTPIVHAPTINLGRKWQRTCKNISWNQWGEATST